MSSYISKMEAAHNARVAASAQKGSDYLEKVSCDIVFNVNALGQISIAQEDISARHLLEVMGGTDMVWPKGNDTGLALQQAFERVMRSAKARGNKVVRTPDSIRMEVAAFSVDKF